MNLKFKNRMQLLPLFLFVCLFKGPVMEMSANINTLVFRPWTVDRVTVLNGSRKDFQASCCSPTGHSPGGLWEQARALGRETQKRNQIKLCLYHSLQKIVWHFCKPSLNNFSNLHHCIIQFPGNYHMLSRVLSFLNSQNKSIDFKK